MVFQAARQGSRQCCNRQRLEDERSIWNGDKCSREMLRQDTRVSPGSAHEVEAIQKAVECLGLNVEQRLDALLAEQRLDSR